MIARLVALDEGPDISLDRAMIVVGRHPACDARLESLRVSRHHCCMTHDGGDILVRDLGSTNGIRINGQRVEMGRLKVGDELSIAHIRYRLDDGLGHDRTLADSSSADSLHPVDSNGSHADGVAALVLPTPFPLCEMELAAAVREKLPRSVAQRCRIQVIVKMDEEEPSDSTPIEIANSHAENSSG